MDTKATLCGLALGIASIAPAYASRPFDGTDADVARPGVMELELGYLGYLREGSQKSIMASAAVVNFGLAHDNELVVEGRVRNRVPREADTQQTTFQDADISEAGSAHRRPSGCCGAERRQRMRHPFANGRGGAHRRCLYRHPLPALGLTTVHFNAAIAKNREGNWEKFLDAIAVGPGFSIARPVFEAYVARDSAGGYTNSALAGVVWAVKDNLSFDVGLRKARSDAFSITELRVGLTWSRPLHHQGNSLEADMTIFLSFIARRSFCAGLCLLMAVLSAGAQPSRTEPGKVLLRQVQDYPLPGRATRWDYMSLDTSSSRLFIAHLGDSAVVVFNTKDKAVVDTIPGVSAVHGVLAVPELGRTYATATGRNEVVAIDSTSLKVTARIPTGKYPDGLAYAPEVHKLYVSDEEGKTETVVDVQSNQRIATIPLGGSVGNTQYDPVSKHIFVNVQTTAELVEIDPGKDAVVQRIRLRGAARNHGLLIEPTLRLAFIACEGNDKLLVLDMRTKQVTSTFDVGGGPDVLAYDQALGMLYVASESGVVHLFKVQAAGVAKVGEVQVGANAHTVAVDPSSHEIFLPLKEVGKPPILRAMRPAL